MKKSDAIGIVILSILLLGITVLYVYYNICFSLELGNLVEFIKYGGEDFIVFGAFWAIVTTIYCFWTTIFICGISAIAKKYDKKLEKKDEKDI